MIVPLRPLIGTSDNGGTWSLVSTTASNWFITYSTDAAHVSYISTSCPSTVLPYSLGAMNDTAYIDTEGWTPGDYVFNYTLTGTCTDVEDVSMQYNPALGSHEGRYVFNLIGEAVDCPTDFNIELTIRIVP